MAKKAVQDLKEGDKISLNNEVCTITKIEKSNIGKHGRVKYRIESTTEKNEPKIIVRSADDVIDLA